MKKHLLFCLAFLAGLGMLLALISFLFFPKEISAEAGLRFPSAYGYAAEPENSLDAVVIGDSLPLYGINPLVIFREQGIACYDCATPQQSLAKSRVFLTDILRRQSPKLVLLETDVLYRSMHRLEPLTELLSWRIPVFAFHDNWKTLSPAQLLRPIRWEQKSEQKGHFSTDAVEAAASADYMDREDPDAAISTDNQRQLRRFRDTCRSRGISLVLVSIPNAASWSKERHKAVNALAESLELPYLDLNQEDLGIDWTTECLDKGDHLNEKGAQKVSAFLGRYLASTGLFPDRREDPAYASWLGEHQ